MAQTDDQGTSVATYCVSISGLEQLGEALEDKDRASGDLAELIQDLGRVPAAKVVFNWECCSSCSDLVKSQGTMTHAIFWKVWLETEDIMNHDTISCQVERVHSFRDFRVPGEHGFQGGGLLPFGGCGQVPQRPSTSDASLRLAKLALNRGYMASWRHNPDSASSGKAREVERTKRQPKRGTFDRISHQVDGVPGEVEPIYRTRLPLDKYKYMYIYMCYVIYTFLF